MQKRTLRIYYIIFILISLAVIFTLFIKTFNENLLFYRSPSQINVGEFPENYIFRIGGVVEDDSLDKSKESMNVKFSITDYEKSINISYTQLNKVYN